MGAQTGRLAVVALLMLSLPLPTAAQEQVPRRLVSLVPSLTETVAALGCSERLVGVSDYVVWPPEVQGLPHLGGLHNPNVERILALAPDLVLVPTEIAKVEQACRAAGIRVEQVRMDDMNDVRQGILGVAQLLGCPERGQALVRDLDRRLQEVRDCAARQPRVSVLLALDRPPTGRLQHLTVAGHGTFLDQLATLAGGDNIFADGRSYFTPSLEEVLRRRPDVIVELRPVASGISELEEQLRQEWQALFGRQPLPRVRVVTGEAILIPGPRMADTAALLCQVLHEPADSAKAQEPERGGAQSRP